ncbi:Type 1 glutamine amidotransferase-like domain-containing protein [Herbiconiux sp. A18JL235]|uniref:Type 1 glutamine amidotransferase-like domain-containing protein n=1 Tax=Herbiconiux sp. A18JL235 TaxID=3152363 RepID=A0AB39BGS2_9MICO
MTDAQGTTVLATCSGWQPSTRAELEFSPLQRFAVELTGVSGRAPRVLYVNTAGGDPRQGEAIELDAARLAGVSARHLRLFGRTDEPLDEIVADADLVWVGGGSVVNLLALWRAHGLDSLLIEAARRGTVLAGTSAGALCWHVGGPTSSRGPALDLVDDGLALVPASLAVHYDSQPLRRPLFHSAIAEGRLPAGHGLDEGTAVLYRDGALIEALREPTGGTVHRVERSSSSETASEHTLDVRTL